MNINLFSSRKYILTVFALLLVLTANAQQKPVADTTHQDFLTELKKESREITKQGINRLRTEKIAIRQDLLIQEIRTSLSKSSAFIKAGIDTVEINNELEKMGPWIKLAEDGVFTNKGTAQTYRNLTVTSKILTELLARTNTRKNLIDNYEKRLVNFRYNIDSLAADTALYTFPQDSSQAREAVNKINRVAAQIRPADKALTYAINNIHKLQTKIDSVAIKLIGSLEEIETYQRNVSANTFKRQFTNLGENVGYSRPFKDIVYISYQKAKLNLLFYTQNNLGRIFIVLMVGVAASIFLLSLKKILLLEDHSFDTQPGHLILLYPILSAIFIALNLGQFIFPEPPVVFNAIFWIISGICLTVIFSKYVTKHWMAVWLTFFALFIGGCLGDLILQASRVERWLMLAFSVTGVIFGLYVLLKGKRDELREKLMLYFITLAIVLEFASVFANIFGRYNLAKSLLVSGYLNVVVGILFLWVVRIINQGLYVASKIYTKQDKKLFYINFDLVGDKAPPLLYFLLVIGWFILFGRNFYIFQTISTPLRNFFFNERTIGEYTFTINNILVFFLVIIISVIVSKIVSYFASDKDTDHVAPGKTRSAGVGSWLLLIRVAIMTIGLFLAFAASGFPIGQLTVIIGALGLGIGLGLQTLVNNLVSGLIIAFEKPVNVGDIVEISGQGGTMKSIGFRSSVISKWDGPDVVIPNGDLLNAHLINWTLAGSKRQMEIVVGIEYGSDLKKPIQIIEDILAANKRIHEHPKPSILFQNFGTTALEIKVAFWVRDYKDGSSVKSEAISAIVDAFDKANIVIPLPQQNVYIHPVQEETAEKKADQTKVKGTNPTKRT